MSNIFSQSLDCNSSALATWGMLPETQLSASHVLLTLSSATPIPSLGSTLGCMLILLVSVFSISISMDISGSLSITLLWVVPWPLGTTLISLMFAVKLGLQAPCLIQLDWWALWVTISVELVPYYSVHTEGSIAILLTEELWQGIALVQNSGYRH